jgi:hypothetical protein
MREGRSYTVSEKDQEAEVQAYGITWKVDEGKSAFVIQESR